MYFHRITTVVMAVALCVLPRDKLIHYKWCLSVKKCRVAAIFGYQMKTCENACCAVAFWQQGLRAARRKKKKKCTHYVSPSKKPRLKVFHSVNFLSRSVRRGLSAAARMCPPFTVTVVWNQTFTGWPTVMLFGYVKMPTLAYIALFNCLFSVPL